MSKKKRYQSQVSETTVEVICVLRKARKTYDEMAQILCLPARLIRNIVYELQREDRG